MTFNGKTISVIFPTYNEKDSIKKAIDDFDMLGIVDELIVINNNAAEGTSEEVKKTNAVEFLEKEQGYGAAILRGLKEAKGDLIAICEPDDTFIARDLFKLLEYTHNFDVVYGSRTMIDMIWEGANMGWFLRFGNWSVAKLMEVLFGTCSLTDVGCTFRIMSKNIRDIVLKKCKVKGNFFGPEMMIVTIKEKNCRILQIPLNYKDRVGESSVTGSLLKAFWLGIRMILLILHKRFLPFIK
jgi:glycosyltransferase involved in cell wall biosynthesis